MPNWTARVESGDQGAFHFIRVSATASPIFPPKAQEQEKGAMPRQTPASPLDLPPTTTPELLVRVRRSRKGAVSDTEV